MRLEGKRKALLGEGDCFNEIALLADVETSETVIALEDVEVLVTGKTEFCFVLLQYPPVLRQLAQMLHIGRPDLPLSGLFASSMVDQEHEPLSKKMSRPDIDRYAGRWIELLLGMGLLFVVFTLHSIFEGHVFWKYAALLTGATVGPVTFVAYIRHSQQLGFRPARLILILLLSAGVAIPTAWILQNWLIYSDVGMVSFSELRTPFTVAIIEEIAKLLLCIGLLRTKQLHFLMDAIVFGAAAGMGFAAIETILYGWSQLDYDSTGGMLAVTWMRALLSPFGHGTWTAIALAGLWYLTNSGQSPKKKFIGTGLVLAVIALHTMWNVRFAEGVWHMLSMMLIGIVGLFLLSWLIRQGREQEHRALVMINPAVDDYYMTVKEVTNGTSKERLSKAFLLCDSCATQSPSHVRYCARCGQSLRLTSRN